MPRAKKKNDEDQATPARATVTVTLVKDHTHAGIDLKAGEVIEVLPRKVEWLRSQGVI